MSDTAARALLARGATLVASYGSFSILDAPPAALAAVEPGAVEMRNGYFRIALNSGDVDTSAPALSMEQRAPEVGQDGKALHLVQFAGPLRPEWYATLLSTGARIVSYIPQNAYLVWGDAPALDRVHKLARRPEVQFDAPYAAALKIDRSLPAHDTGAYAIQLVEDTATNGNTLALVRVMERRESRVSAALGFVNVVIHADLTALDALAARPDVVSIQPWVEPRLFDERQDVIVAGQITSGLPDGPGYLDWLTARGFTQAQFDGSGFGVDVTDSGIDNGTTAPNHFGLYSQGSVLGTSRVVYVRHQGTPNAGSTIEGCDGHGNVNAHIIAGYNALTGTPHTDASGYRFGLGVAPFVRVGGSVIFDPDWYTNPDFEDLISRAWADGMRLSSNSWGAGTSSYTSQAQRYDALVRDAAPDGSAVPQAGNQEMVIVFAAGNAGPSSGSVGTPGNAKNVLSAGASENVHPFGGADQCGMADSTADAALDVAWFSSQGPAADGRIRPDLLAPGTHVTGGVAQDAVQHADPPGNAMGQANSCFVGSGVCGGVGSIFFPSGQQWYTASSGTSHSTPAIAGAAALLRQYFLNQGLSAPSPAMTKAYLMSSARYMTGAYANDDLYSNAQGMGLLDMGFAFDGTPRLLRDQDAADVLTATGQTRTFTSGIGDPSKPFRVTLAWTDAPGSTSGAAWNNDLDLTVDVGGTVYRGNVFTGATSSSGGTADASNNVESVFLPAGTTGTATITVTAANVNSDGIPGNGAPLDQDFALVVTNSCGDAPPAAPSSVTATATALNVITVDWGLSAGATAYLVYRSTSSGGPYTLVSTSAAPPFVDSGRSGGTTYYYVVRAQQGCAVSTPSAEASATATGACMLTPTFAGLDTAATTGEDVCGVALAWAAATPSCGGTLAYDVYRSTTSGFAPDPSSRIATGVTATSFLDGNGLTGGTPYYYVVRAVETTADGSVDDGNTVERTATPMRVALVLQDDFDANRPATPDAWWIERTLAGSDQLGLVSGCRWQSTDTSYRFGAASATCGGAYTNGADNLLVLGGDGSVSASVNGIVIPAGATLSFRLWYQFEPWYDGARLVYSTTGANGSFLVVPDAVTAGSPYIVSGGYDGALLWGDRGWTGTLSSSNGALRETVVNLDALAGQTVWFGWRMQTDSSVVYEGIYIDDVLIEARDAGCASCETPAPPIPAGLTAIATADNELTVDWTPNGAAFYEVQRAAVSGGPYTTIATVTAAPFVDSGLSGGNTYYYVVRAGQDCALSDPSAEASATVTGPCITPPTFAGLASAATTGDVTCGNVLSWPAATASCGGTLAYDVFRSTDPGFVPDATNRIAQGVAATGYVDSGDLVSGTEYHYVVRAVETSAAGPVSDPNSERRSAAPARIAQRFRDDFDANRPAARAASWIERVTTGSDQLQILNGCRYHSPTNAYRFGNSAETCGGYYPYWTRNTLVLGGDGSTPGVNGIEVPSNGGTLAFRLWYSLYDYYDGAWLTYSTTGASGPFNQVPDSVSAAEPYISTGGYDGVGANGSREWSGSRGGANGDLAPVVVNLDALAGQTAWFAWEFDTRYYSSYLEGLYLDDVVVEGGGACSTAATPPGAPVRFAVSGVPGTVVADEAFAATLTALDAYDQVSTGYSGPASLSSSDAQAVLPGPVTFTSGVASVTVRLRTAGVRSLTVRDVADTAVLGSADTTVLGGAPTSLAFTVQPTTQTAGSGFWPEVAVGVRDAFGNATAAAVPVTIALSPNPGSATLFGTTTVSSVSGVARFWDIFVEKAAVGYGLVATSPGLADAASSTFDILAGPAVQLAFLQQPLAAVAGEPIAPAPSVSLVDSYGNPTASAAPVDVQLAAGPAGATLMGTTSVLGSDGVAVFDDLAVDKAGSGYVLLATSGSTLSASSEPFAAVAGPPYRVLLTQQPGNVRAGEPFSPPIGAMLFDRFDNHSASATTPVSLSFASNPTSATLLGTTTVAATGGVVSFPGVAVDRPGTPFALYAGASGLFGDTSVGFEILPALAAAYSVQGPETAVVGTPGSYTVTAVDALATAVPYYTGTATVTTSDTAAELPGTVAFTEGVATISVTFQTAGAQTLTFTESAGSTTGSISVGVDAPPPPDSDDGCGCGTGNAGSSAALLALLILARPRRRTPSPA